MYTLFGPRASRAFRVLWALEEMGLAYTHRPEPPRSEAVRAVNPAGKVPVLVDGDTALTDSTAILAFLADRHGALTHPPGSHARARQDAVMQMLLDEFDALLWTAARHSFILPEDRRVPAIKDSLRWEFARNAARLAEGLTGPFLAGETMTIADIVGGHCLVWATAARFEIAEPALVDYFERMRARPAFGRAAAAA